MEDLLMVHNVTEVCLFTINTIIYWYFYQSKLQGNMFQPEQGCTEGEGGGGVARLQTPSSAQNRNLKNTDFVDIMISKVLHDCPFSRNQPLKSAY
jgi:hypothetical protein